MTIEDMALLPELSHTPFPFRGKLDFRDFSDDDYAAFAGGLFRALDNLYDPDGPLPSKRCKWMGGRDKFGPALKTILMLGFDCRCKFPHVEMTGNEEDGRTPLKNKWYVVLFECPGRPS